MTGRHEQLRREYERAIRERRRAVALLRHLMRPAMVPSLLVVANLAVHLLVVAYSGDGFWGRLFDGDGLHYPLLRCGAKVNALIAQGQIWRLLVPVFLHGSLLHLAVNSVGIYYLGRFTENVFGRRRTFLLYTLAGIGGNVASALWSDALSVGASGAMLGLLGALGVFLARVRSQIPPSARRIVTLVPLFWLVFTVGVGLSAESVDNAAHLGGFFVGVVLGLSFQSELFSPSRRPDERAVSASTVLMGGVLVVAGALAVFTALRPLPPLHVRLAPSARVGGTLPVPVDWTVGRLVDWRCVAVEEIESGASAVPSDAPWCFRDPWETMVIVGRAERIYAGEEHREMVAWLDSANGPLPVRRDDWPGETDFTVALGGGLTYVVVCHAELATRYEPLAAAVYDFAKESWEEI